MPNPPDPAPPDPPDRPPRAARIAGGAICLTGLLAAGSWVFQQHRWLALDSDYYPMAPTTGIGFALLGLALVLTPHRTISADSTRGRWAGGLATGVAIAALIGGVQLLLGHTPVWDAWMPPPNGPGQTPAPGRVSPATLLAFALSAIGLRAHLSVRLPAWVASSCATAGLAIGALFALSYAAGMPMWYGGNIVPMALLTALLFVGQNSALLLGPTPPPRHRPAAPPGANPTLAPPSGIGLRWRTTGIIVAALIVTAGIAYLRLERATAVATVRAQLEAIAHLKARQVESWRTERFAEARFLQRTREVRQSVWALLEHPNDTAAQDRVREWLEPIKGGDRYQAVAIYDPTGRPLYGIGPPYPGWMPDPIDVRGLPDQAEPWFGPMRRTSAGGLRLDLIVRLDPPRDGPTVSPPAWIILELDPATTLFPLVRSWPLPSRTAEAYLVSRTADQLLVLSELRTHPDAPLQVRLPAPPGDWPDHPDDHPVGTQLNLDHRGVPVISTVHAISDCPWRLIAQIDRAEAFAPLLNTAWQTGALVAALLVALAFALTVLWRHREALHVHHLLDAERERSALLTRLGLVMRHANDVILLFDAERRIVDANDRAVAVYGWSHAELRGLPVESLRPESNRLQAAESFAAAQGETNGRVFETVHQHRDGRTFPVEVSARPVEIDGRPHVLSIIRDMSERKAHEQEIERLNHLYQLISQINQAILRGGSVNELADEICRVLVRQDRFRTAWIGWHDPVRQTLPVAAVQGKDCEYVAALDLSTDSGCPEGLGPSGIAFRENRVCVSNDFLHDPITRPWRDRAAAQGIRASIALPLHQDRATVGVLSVYASETDVFGPREVELLQEAAGDISFALDMLAREEHRQAAERALLQSESRLKLLLTRTPAVIYALTADGLFTTSFLSGNVAEVLGYSPGEFRHDPGFWSRTVHPDDRAPAQDAVANMDSSGKVVRNYRIRHRDGSYRWLHDELQSVRDTDGLVLEYVGFFIDITARMEANRELHSLVKELRALHGVSRLVERGDLDLITLLERIVNLLPDAMEEPALAQAEIVLRDLRVRAGAVGGRRHDLHHPIQINHQPAGSITIGYIDGAATPAGFRTRDREIVEGVALTLGLALGQRESFEQVRRSEERFRAIFDHAAVGMFETDASGRVARANPCFAALLDRPVADLIGRPWTALLRAAPQPAADGACALPCEEPTELEFQRGDGATFWGLLKGRRETGFESESPAAGHICILHDVSDTVRARQTMQRFNAELEEKVAARTREIQGILQAVPDQLLRLRTDGTVLYHHRAPHAHAFGTLPGSGASATPFGAAPDLTGWALELGRQSLADQQTATAEHELVLPAGSLSVEMRAAPVGPDEFVVLVRDITTRRRIEQETAAMLQRERQVSEMKTRFISVTSHEFRTPMAAAMGSAELLAHHFDRLSEDKRLELCDRIKGSLRRMTEMLDDVLTLNRIDAGRTTAKQAPVDLRRLLHQIADEIRTNDRDQHPIDVRCPEPNEPFVSDAGLLHHILSNLLANAARYSAAGSPVDVTVETDATGVLLTVADRGIGIPASERDRVFEPFERGSNVGASRGTGLGLSIVRRMTELLGGTVQVRDRDGGGTVFAVALPRPVVSPAP